MTEDIYEYPEDMEYSETSTADEYSVNENINNSENDDNQSSISEGVIIDENNENNNNSESQLNQEEAPKWQSQFKGNSFDCTCYGSCLCKRYRQKSPYDTDCFYCNHHLNDHTPR